MDKDRIKGSAEQAKGKVKEVAGKVAGDAKLESEGHDTAAAVDLLKQFVEAQELYERDRDRLMTKLANAS